MPHVLVVLSGCGYLDGAEISEAVISLLALSRGGARVTIAAPDQDQHHVVDHLSGQVTGERRNVMREAARIARGRILPLSATRVEDYDAIWMPGGFGAAKNLSSFAFEGAAGSVQAQLGDLLRAFRTAGKPIGAVCIAPAVLALALREGKVTIGNDPGCAGAIESLGGQHQACPVTELCVDEERRIVTAPAYMYDASIADVATGIEAAVGALLRLCGEQP